MSTKNPTQSQEKLAQAKDRRLIEKLAEAGIVLSPLCRRIVSRTPRRTDKAAKERRLIKRFAELARMLTAIKSDDDALYPGHFYGAAPNKGSFDRRHAIMALRNVIYFLGRCGAYSPSLEQLQRDLSAVELRSEMPAMLKPMREAGRALSDSRSLKGHFAGLAYVKMQSGMSRDQAASWVARNIPSHIAPRISPSPSKPIRPSTVKEWMGQFGCSSQIRRELKSLSTRVKSLSTEAERDRSVHPTATAAGFDTIHERILLNFMRSKNVGGDDFGEWECLRTMFAGQLGLAAEPPE